MDGDEERGRADRDPPGAEPLAPAANAVGASSTLAPGGADDDLERTLPGFEEIARTPAGETAEPAPDMATAEARVAFPAWRATPAPIAPIATAAAPAPIATAAAPAPIATAAATAATGRTTHPEPAVAAPRASFGRRAVALLVDIMLLAGAELVVGWIAALAVDVAAMLGGGGIAAGADLAATLASVGSFLLPVVYFTELHTGEGQTLGKALAGIRVARPDGSPIGLLRSLGRWFAYTLSSIPLGFGYLLALGPSRRALHDLVAGTVVLAVPPGRGRGA